MTVARLKKITLVGPARAEQATLAALQELGCMHVLPLVPPPSEPEEVNEREAKDAYKALRFLSAVPEPRRQIMRERDFDVTRFVDSVRDLMQRRRVMLDRRDFLRKRIADVRPWGDFTFPPHEALAGLRLWFYTLPLKHKDALQTVELPWAILQEDHRVAYAVLIAAEEPDEALLPVPRTHVGAKPLRELETDLEDTEIALEAIDAERLAVTRYLTLLRQNLSTAETLAELAYARQKVRTEEWLFALQGWVPEDRAEEVLAMADSQGAAALVEEPKWNEAPPTLLEQPEKNDATVDLALFYKVPAYNGWDPSQIVLASFAIFFAMIVADAGYGMVILLGVLACWKRFDASPHLQSWRRLALTIAGATVLYGVMVGSYFGVSPAEGSLWARLKVLDLNNYGAMMLLSIVVGVLHLVLANALAARAAWGRNAAYANLGWIAVLTGGLLLWRASLAGSATGPSVALMLAGVGAIVIFASERPVETPMDWLWRLLSGLQNLAGAMGAFGDVLSYMRLFALGLASASLAITFNDLATSVMQALKGPGILFGLLILIIGHLLNFGLAMMSGVVHGLRLNYIEFFKWGLPDEGTVFRPLTRKEVQK